MTAKQQRFVFEYLKDLNAYQAAIRAGYSESTAMKKASLWVGKSRDSCPENVRHIWDAVNEEKKKRMERLKIDAEYVLRGLVEMAEADVSQLFDSSGAVRPLSQIPQPLLSRLTDVNNFKLTPKIELLKLIGQHVQVNAFKKQVDVNGGIDVADAILRAAKCRRKLHAEEARIRQQGIDNLRKSGAPSEG